MVVAPKPCWTATDGIIFAKDLASSSASSGVINCDANNNSFCDTKSKDSLTSKVDEWFEDLIQIDEQIKKESNAFLDKCDKGKLLIQLNVANNNTPQHDANELAQPSLLFNRLHDLHESKKVSKHMLSAHVRITKECVVE